MVTGATMAAPAHRIRRGALTSADPSNPSTPITVSTGVVIVGFLVCLARSEHPSQRFSFWAEDGTIFTAQVRADGIAHSFFTTYGGYLLSLPRAVAAVASVFPLEWSPPIYAVAAMLVSSVVAAIAYRAGREALRLPIGPAAVLAGTVLLLPAAGAETFGTLTNTEWYCLAGVVVYLAAWFEGWQTSPIPTGVLLFVAATTTPLAVVACPFVVVRLIKERLAGSGGRRCLPRGRRALDIAVVVGLLGGVCVTFVAHLVAPASAPVGTVDVPRLAAQYTVRAVDNSVLGDRLVLSMFNGLGELTCAVIGLAAFVVIVAVAALVGGSRWTTLLLIVTSLLLFAVPAVVRDVSLSPDLAFPVNGEVGASGGGRYFAVPALCLTLVILLVLRPPESVAPADSNRARHMLLMASSALLAVVLIFNVPLNLYRQSLGAWEQPVAQGRRSCSADHGHGQISVPVAPGVGWNLVLTCKQAFGD